MNTEVLAGLRNFDHLPDSANVRQPVVEALFACSAATIWRRVRKGTLPSPRKLSDRVTAWQVGELRRALKGEVEWTPLPKGKKKCISKKAQKLAPENWPEIE